MQCDLETSLPEWILEYPETQTVFDQLGLDTSCGGKSLEYVCQRQGLNPASVMEQLLQVTKCP